MKTINWLTVYLFGMGLLTGFGLMPQKVTAIPRATALYAKNLNIPDSAHTITSSGIGTAKIGMTYQQLKQQLGSQFQFQVKTSYIVDFDAIAVSKAGKVQYYILYPAGTKFTSGNRLEYLATNNPEYQTKKGVGTGMPIERAELVYGSARLAFSHEDESREYIYFPKAPKGLLFRSQPPKNLNFAGKYSNKSKFETRKYHRSSAIGTITVS
jgi:hypothetical protein